jgi:hypothetical protein
MSQTRFSITSQEQSDVAAVYQRHDFLAERKDALDRWGLTSPNSFANFKADDQ